MSVRKISGLVSGPNHLRRQDTSLFPITRGEHCYYHLCSVWITYMRFLSPLPLSVFHDYDTVAPRCTFCTRNL